MWRKTKKENKNTHKFPISENENTFFHHNSYNNTYYNNSLLTTNCDKTKIYQNKKKVLGKKSDNNFIVSEQYIMNNAEIYGEVKEDEDNNSTDIYLYRRNIALTQNEINVQNESLYPIDLTGKKMSRRPLQSCEHKPLNNDLIKYDLNYHCLNYHNNDNKQYLFYFQNKFGWKQVKYPPRDEQLKTYNNMMNNTELRH